MPLSRRQVTRHILGFQTLTGAFAFGVIALVAPLLLVLEWDSMAGILWVGAQVAGLAIGVSTAASFLHLQTHKSTILALTTEKKPINTAQIQSLAALPRALSLLFFTANSLIAASLSIPGIRPEKLDGGRAVSLLVLSITILSAAAIPYYMVLRNLTIQLLDMCPAELLTALLDGAELHQTPSRNIVRRFLVAAAAPVALVGVGAVLITHAHLRTGLEQSKRNTAAIVARAALEPPRTGIKDTGLEDAISAAAEFGFLTQLKEASLHTEPAFQREADSELTVTVPLDSGEAVIRFTAQLDPEGTYGVSLIAALGVVFSLILGGLFGRWLSTDLVIATQGVRMLGTESILRGSARVARPARFAVVLGLGQAIEGLAERFRVFAAAQERALEARDAAQRMRGLLFASVSHDLKSPLNAILGFAELVGHEPLSKAQRESLDLIAHRGRELLALIETILDAARVEAGQLTLASKFAEVGPLITEAVCKARELAGDTVGEITAEIADDLPAVPVDFAYVTRALGTIIAHALRTAASDPAARLVRIRATQTFQPEELVAIDIEYASRDVSKEELCALFEQQVTSRGRGLTLGLSLARSVIELHGGIISVDSAADQRAVCRAYLPLNPPGGRPRLSSMPRLA